MKRSPIFYICLLMTACGFYPLVSCLKKAPDASRSEVIATRQPLQHASSGSVDRLYVYSPELTDTVTVDIWTPEGYDPHGTRRYPVIYMHDGQNLFDAATTWNHQAWEMDSVTSSLIAAGVIEAPVIVGVHSVSNTRIGDLMPQKVLDYNPALTETLTSAFPEITVRGDAYASFLVNTLKPLVDTTYCVRPDASSTSVMGSSMGGLMSIYALCEYPATFGGAGCLSTHWVGTVDGNPAFPNAMLDYLRDKLPADGAHKLYLDHGTTSIDSLYGPWNTRVIALAESVGYSTPATLDTLTATGAGHEERYWAARVARPLSFLLKN